MQYTEPDPIVLEVDKLASFDIVGKVKHNARLHPLSEVTVGHEEHVGHIARGDNTVKLRFVAANYAHVYLYLFERLLPFFQSGIFFVDFAVIRLLECGAHLFDKVGFRRAAVIPMAEREHGAVTVIGTRGNGANRHGKAGNDKNDRRQPCRELFPR